LAENEKPGNESPQEPDEAVTAEEQQDEAEVEGHAISVDEFNADGRNVDVHCGAYYADN